MFFQVESISIDYDKRPIVLTDSQKPIFTWVAKHSEDGAYQSVYELTVTDGKGVVWQSGEVNTKDQRAVYGGDALVSGEFYTVTVVLKDHNGNASAPASAVFRYLGDKKWSAEWITTQEKRDLAAKYFYRGFELDEMPVRATLYASGIGYQYVTVNGDDVEGTFLNPAVSHYKKMCYYTVTDVTGSLKLGKNGIFAIVGDGWRAPHGFFARDRAAKGDSLMFGDTQLIAELELDFADGTRRVIATDESWLAGFGAITENSLFNGETYNATLDMPLWDTPEFDGAGLEKAVKSVEKVGELKPQTLPPVSEQYRLKARVIRRIADGGCVFDFGANIAGIGCFTIPKGIAPNTRITIEYAEEILPNGDLDKETLRAAKATDVFIAGEKNPESWTPRLTYHGFRYAKISGLDVIPTEDTLVAIAFFNDIKNGSFFKCGDALVNNIQDIIVRTEMDNLHHLATDCPQRDERMGWMNDATVRFEETPYNFNMGRLFPKILLDMALDQDPESGSVTATAPFIFGGIPADPVCSSFLVMGLEMLLHYGDTESVKKYYEPFKRWNECIAGLRNEEGIVEFALYSDWAGPADFCNQIFDGARSVLTPGVMTSTGYLYHNYKLLARFAEVLGYDEEKADMLEKAKKVQNDFLKKWFDQKHGCYVHNGSQAAQSFALWLGILPPECEKEAAKRLFEAVKNVGYRVTTGNLTTKYLLDMLAKYGYEDAAWKLLTRQEYPSWGYMIQNGATTIWERFEMKRGSRMNSHNHPMYGAIGYWFYAHLLGVTPLEYGWKRFVVAPCFPDDLLHAEGKIDTVMGDIYVKWQKQYGKLDVLVDVPFGATAQLKLPYGEYELASGCHSFSFDLE